MAVPAAILVEARADLKRMRAERDAMAEQLARYRDHAGALAFDLMGDQPADATAERLRASFRRAAGELAGLDAALARLETVVAELEPVIN